MLAHLGFVVYADDLLHSQHSEPKPFNFIAELVKDLFDGNIDIIVPGLSELKDLWDQASDWLKQAKTQSAEEALPPKNMWVLAMAYLVENFHQQPANATFLEAKLEMEKLCGRLQKDAKIDDVTVALGLPFYRDESLITTEPEEHWRLVQSDNDGDGRLNEDPFSSRFVSNRNYPFNWKSEVGQGGGIVLSPAEIENLRQYLLRGGFLLIDDFWGQRQWDNFYAAFSQLFPDREIVELSPDHEIFHVYYDIDGPQMIPALYRSDEYGEQGINTASNHAILDDQGRVMVLINWNSDMGDGWEHTYHPDYPTRYANSAYRLGINYLMYSLTH